MEVRRQLNRATPVWKADGSAAGGRGPLNTGRVLKSFASYLLLSLRTTAFMNHAPLPQHFPASITPSPTPLLHTSDYQHLPHSNTLPYKVDTANGLPNLPVTLDQR